MENWRLITIPCLRGQANMGIDLGLFNDLERGAIPSTLRIYSWQPNCISLGYSQNEDRLIDGKMARALGWDIVKRPTGGGIVFHNEAEVTYSIVTEIGNPLLPKGLVPSYKKISEAVVAGLAGIGVAAELQTSNIKLQNKSKSPNQKSRTSLCFSFPAEYEIVVSGKKIVGSAQKRGRRALLQQGSIFVRRPPEEIFPVLKEPYSDHNAVSVEEVLGREVGFCEISTALAKGFSECFGIDFGI